MKTAWIAPFLLILAITPALAAETGSSDQQTDQTQGSVSPNAINPGRSNQPDGHTQGGENQRHTDDFGPSRTVNAEGDTDPGADSSSQNDRKTPETGADHDTGSGASANSDT